MVSATAGEQVDVDVDLDAQVPCIGMPDACSRPAIFVVRIRHADCPAKTYPRPMCEPCLLRLKALLDTGSWGCGLCQEIVLPADLQVHPL